MKKIIKKSIPIEILYEIKNRRKMINKKEIKTIEKDKKYIFYIDAPEYGNLGDQAIALGVRTFIQTNFPEYVLYEIQQDVLPYYLESLKNNIRPSDLICLTGGGNMGNTYTMYEGTRRKIIKEFPNNRIIIFPQTVDYEKDICGRRELKASSTIYNKHRNLVLIAREKATFELMKQIYKDNKVLLCPDIVLYLKPINDELKRENIGVCLRKDIETNMTQEDRSKVLELLKSREEKIFELSTVIDVKRIDTSERELVLKQKFNEFKSYKLIITDRLHGMIFSVITGTPCIVFKCKNHKIEGVYEWIKDISYVRFVSSIKEFEITLNELDLDKEYLYNQESKFSLYKELKSMFK